MSSGRGLDVVAPNPDIGSEDLDYALGLLRRTVLSTRKGVCLLIVQATTSSLSYPNRDLVRSYRASSDSMFLNMLHTL